MATQEAKKKRNSTMKITAKKITESAIEVSDNLVEGSLATGAKWQKIMSKALAEGTVLFGKQQDLTLTALEEIKGQLISGNKRFRKIFGFQLPSLKNTLKVKKANKIEKITKLKAVKKSKATAKVVKKTAPVKTEVAKDNLRMIQGVGPKIETLLNQAGINTFAQIASTNIKDLKTILDAAGPRFKRHNPNVWKTQAKTLAKK